MQDKRPIELEQGWKYMQARSQRRVQAVVGRCSPFGNLSAIVHRYMKLYEVKDMQRTRFWHNGQLAAWRLLAQGRLRSMPARLLRLMHAGWHHQAEDHSGGRARGVLPQRPGQPPQLRALQ